MAKSSGKSAERRPDGMPVGTPFPKGVSGNPAGKPKGLRHSKTILRELLEIEEDVVNPITGEVERVNQLDMILAKLVQHAKRGDGWSIDRVLDRVEGKPEQTTKNVNVNANIEATAESLSEAPDALVEAMAKLIKESRRK